jgi:hypothetical protein
MHQSNQALYVDILLDNMAQGIEINFPDCVPLLFPIASLGPSRNLLAQVSFSVFSYVPQKGSARISR